MIEQRGFTKYHEEAYINKLRLKDPNEIMTVEGFQFDVKAWNRKFVRRELQGNGFRFKEYKGFLDSTFMLKGKATVRQALRIYDWLNS